MLKKISHIAIAVKDLQSAKKIYYILCHSQPFPDEIVAEQRVKVSKFKIGELTIELLEPTDSSSPIAKFLKKRGEGIHHIAFESDNIIDDMEYLEKNGFEFINKEPVVGSDKMLIAFVKPISTCGVLTEICQH